MNTQSASTSLRQRYLSRVALALATLLAVACSDNAFTTHPSPNETAASFGRGGPKAPQSKILFGTNRDGAANEIYSMNPDGSAQTRLSFTRVNDGEAVYSPDGTKIAFYSARDNALGEIYVMKADGSNVKRITNNSFGDIAPQWSPDGLHIAFASDRDHQGQVADRDLYLMNTDGSNVKRLTTQDGQIADASWDPAGKRLTYSVIPASTNPGIFVLDVTTLAVKQLTFAPGFTDAWPSFSPDGTKIAYAHYVNGLADIWIMNDDGSNPTQITTNAANDSWPKWSR